MKIDKKKHNRGLYKSRNLTGNNRQKLQDSDQPVQSGKQRKKRSASSAVSNFTRFAVKQLIDNDDASESARKIEQTTSTAVSSTKTVMRQRKKRKEIQKKKYQQTGRKPGLVRHSFRAYSDVKYIEDEIKRAALPEDNSDGGKTAKLIFDTKASIGKVIVQSLPKASKPKIDYKPRLRE